jgi:hypothetical protein
MVTVQQRGSDAASLVVGVYGKEREVVVRRVGMVLGEAVSRAWNRLVYRPQASHKRRS